MADGMREQIRSYSRKSDGFRAVAGSFANHLAAHSSDGEVKGMIDLTAYDSQLDRGEEYASHVDRDDDPTRLESRDALVDPRERSFDARQDDDISSDHHRGSPINLTATEDAPICIFDEERDEITVVSKAAGESEEAVVVWEVERPRPEQSISSKYQRALEKLELVKRRTEKRSTTVETKTAVLNSKHQRLVEMSLEHRKKTNEVISVNEVDSDKKRRWQRLVIDTSEMERILEDPQTPSGGVKDFMSAFSYEFKKRDPDEVSDVIFIDDILHQMSQKGEMPHLEVEESAQTSKLPPAYGSNGDAPLGKVRKRNKIAHFSEEHAAKINAIRQNVKAIQQTKLSIKPDQRARELTKIAVEQFPTAKLQDPKPEGKEQFQSSFHAESIVDPARDKKNKQALSTIAGASTSDSAKLKQSPSIAKRKQNPNLTRHSRANLFAVDCAKQIDLRIPDSLQVEGDAIDKTDLSLSKETIGHVKEKSKIRDRSIRQLVATPFRRISPMPKQNAEDKPQVSTEMTDAGENADRGPATTSSTKKSQRGGLENLRKRGAWLKPQFLRGKNVKTDDKPNSKVDAFGVISPEVSLLERALPRNEISGKGRNTVHFKSKDDVISDVKLKEDIHSVSIQSPTTQRARIWSRAKKEIRAAREKEDVAGSCAKAIPVKTTTESETVLSSTPDDRETSGMLDVKSVPDENSAIPVVQATEHSDGPLGGNLDQDSPPLPDDCTHGDENKKSESAELESEPIVQYQQVSDEVEKQNNTMAERSHGIHSEVLCSGQTQLVVDENISSFQQNGAAKESETLEVVLSSSVQIVVDEVVSNAFDAKVDEGLISRQSREFTEHKAFGHGQTSGAEIVDQGNDEPFNASAGDILVSSDLVPEIRQLDQENPANGNTSILIQSTGTGRKRISPSSADTRAESYELTKIVSSSRSPDETFENADYSPGQAIATDNGLAGIQIEDASEKEKSTFQGGTGSCEDEKLSEKDVSGPCDSRDTWAAADTIAAQLSGCGLINPAVEKISEVSVEQDITTKTNPSDDKGSASYYSDTDIDIGDVASEPTEKRGNRITTENSAQQGGDTLRKENVLLVRDKTSSFVDFSPPLPTNPSSTVKETDNSMSEDTSYTTEHSLAKISIVDSETTVSEMDEEEGMNLFSCSGAIKLLDITCAWLEKEEQTFCLQPNLLDKKKEQSPVKGRSPREKKLTGRTDTTARPSRSQTLKRYFHSSSRQRKSRHSKFSDSRTSRSVERMSQFGRPKRNPRIDAAQMNTTIFEVQDVPTPISSNVSKHPYRRNDEEKSTLSSRSKPKRRRPQPSDVAFSKRRLPTLDKVSNGDMHTPLDSQIAHPSISATPSGEISVITNDNIAKNRSADDYFHSTKMPTNEAQRPSSTSRLEGKINHEVQRSTIDFRDAKSYSAVKNTKNDSAAKTGREKHAKSTAGLNKESRIDEQATAIVFQQYDRLERSTLCSPETARTALLRQHSEKLDASPHHSEKIQHLDVTVTNADESTSETNRFEFGSNGMNSKQEIIIVSSSASFEVQPTTQYQQKSPSEVKEAERHGRTALSGSNSILNVEGDEETLIMVKSSLHEGKSGITRSELASRDGSGPDHSIPLPDVHHESHSGASATRAMYQLDSAKHSSQEEQLAALVALKEQIPNLDVSGQAQSHSISPAELDCNQNFHLNSQPQEDAPYLTAIDKRKTVSFECKDRNQSPVMLESLFEPQSPRKVESTQNQLQRTVPQTLVDLRHSDEETADLIERSRSAEPLAGEKFLQNESDLHPANISEVIDCVRRHDQPADSEVYILEDESEQRMIPNFSSHGRAQGTGSRLVAMDLAEKLQLRAATLKRRRKVRERLKELRRADGLQ